MSDDEGADRTPPAERTSAKAGGERAFEQRVAILAFVVAMLAFLVHRTAAEAIGPTDGVLIEDELLADASVEASRILASEALDELVRGEPSTRGAERPLAQLSLQLDAALGAGRRAVSRYRRTGVALHALNAGLLVALGAFLLRNAWAAGAAGLAFAVHPLVVEPVLWIGERGTLLAACLGLLASIVHVRRAQAVSPRRGLLLGELALLGLALLAHPGAACLPLVWIVFDLGPLRRFGRRPLLGTVPALLLALPVLLVHGRRLALELAASAGELAPRVGRPVDLSVVYPGGASYGLVGADSLAYLPLLVVTLVFAGLLAVVARPGRAHAVRVAAVAVLGLGLALPLAAATRARQAEWADGVLLYRRAVDVAPNAPAAHLLYGEALVRSGRSDEAIRAFEDAIALDPFTPGAHATLGELHLARGDIAAAVEAHQSGYGLNPEDAGQAAALARALARRARPGDVERAIELLRGAVALDPTDPLTQHELGVRLLLTGEHAEAEGHLVEAVRLRPRWTQARASYARLLIAARRWDEAQRELEAGLAVDAGDHELHNNLAVVLTELGDDAAALEHAETTARLRDDQADVHHNHANALARAGRQDEALAAYDRALALDPSLLPTVVNRALLLKELGRVDEAIAGLARAVELAPENEELRSMLETLRGGG